MTLASLPSDLARLVKAFLTLEDIVVLVGCAQGDARTHGLEQFLPAVEQLDALVPDSAWCVRTERRQRTKHQRVLAARLAPRTDPYRDSTSSVYDNASLRNLLLRNADYAALARSKLDAAEALGHVGVASDDVASSERVAIEILETQWQRRQLNRFALARTLVAALRLSARHVVQWILQRSLKFLPPRLHVDVMLATCQYEDRDVGHRIVSELLQQQPAPAVATLRRVCAAAAAHGREKLVHSMLDSLISQHHRCQDAMQDALVAAAEGGHLELVHMLVRTADAHGVVMDATDALACACRQNHRDVAEYLLTLTSLLVTVSNKTPISPSCPLAAAVEGGTPELVAAVLADPRLNAWNPVAFQRAVGDANVSIVKQLLKHEQCPPKEVVTALRSVPRCAVQSQILGALLQYQRGCPVDSWELVEIVCSHGDVEAMEQLLAASESEADCIDRKYWRPLVTAARHGHCDIVRRILQGDGVWRRLSMTKSLDSDAELAEALLAACHRDHLSTAQQLFDSVGLDMIQLLRIVEAAAAAPTATVLHWLLTSRHAVVSKCDLDAALQYACAHGRIDATRLLLSHTQVRFADGLAIQFAASSGVVDLVALLLADPRVNQRYDLETALVDASREGHAAVVALLLSDARLVVTSGAAFHEAADRGHVHVLKRLLNAPAMWLDPTVLDLPLAFARAARHGHYDVLFLLLNDPRVSLPDGGAITRVDDLPKRPGDPMWCHFLRRYLRHRRVDPTANDNQLLLDACLQAKRGVVDALLRSGRVTVDAMAIDAVDDLVRLSSAASMNRVSAQRARRYPLLAQDLRCHLRNGKQLSSAVT